jgi:Mor family transcriptional regulator
VSRYTNATNILPPELLREVQRHAAGRQLYIPSPAARAHWGQHTGARESLRRRNAEIRRQYRDGSAIRELMSRFHLSYDSVRKIVHAKPDQTSAQE